MTLMNKEPVKKYKQIKECVMVLTSIVPGFLPLGDCHRTSLSVYEHHC